MTPTGINLTLDVEKQKISVGGSSGMNPPLRQVSHTDISNQLVQSDKLDFFLDYTDDALEVMDERTTGAGDKDTQEEEYLTELDENIVEEATLGGEYNENQKQHNKEHYEPGGR